MPYVYTPELDLVMANQPMGFLRADLHAGVVHSNGYLEKTYGLSFSDLHGNAWQNILQPEDKENLLLILAKEFFLTRVNMGFARFNTPANPELPCLLIIDSLTDESGNRTGFAINVIDVSLALHDFCKMSTPNIDPLTGLTTRAYFLHKLERILWERRDRRLRTALVIIDLYGLEKINHLWGYTLGDNLLENLAVILKRKFGEKYVLGRIESDKFGLIVEAVKSQDELKNIVESIYSETKQSVSLTQGKFTLAVSIGVAITSTEDGSMDVLVRYALEALAEAKKNEPRIDYISEEDHRIYRRRQRIAESLFDAISQDQFELHYQPQVHIAQHKLAGIEVLLRWMHPDLGIIEPDEFIAIAEESGFIVHVGKWVIEHALSQYKLWATNLGDRLKGIKLSINLSPLQLMDENLVADVNEMLKRYEMDASNLIFELTETAMMSDSQKNIAILNQLKDLGINLSMDDFGTEYSSLNYLRFLPITQIKIDRSFIKAFQHSRRDAAVVKHTISLAEALGMDVIAEGVETETELKFLRENGCTLVQGFYYSHPLNAQGMEEYISANA